jgi:hypothetical protein
LHEWVIVLGGALSVVLWVSLQYLRVIGDESLAVLVALTAIGSFLAYMLTHRISGHLHCVKFNQNGFEWAGAPHSWSAVKSVSPRDISEDYFGVVIKFEHHGKLIERCIWVYKSQDARGLMLELRQLCNTA